MATYIIAGLLTILVIWQCAVILVKSIAAGATAVPAVRMLKTVPR